MRVAKIKARHGCKKNMMMVVDILKKIARVGVHFGKDVKRI